MFNLRDGALSPAPRFRKTTLAGPVRPGVRQLVGTVHVHPNGRTVYVANRASDTVEFAGQRVFAGGENSLAVFAIDPASGEPNLIQHIDTHGIHPRCFHIDPSGRLLVVAHIMGLNVRDGDSVRAVPARLSVFRIGDDGRLDVCAHLRRGCRQSHHVVDGHILTSPRCARERSVTRSVEGEGDRAATLPLAQCCLRRALTRLVAFRNLRRNAAATRLQRSHQ